MADNTKKHDSDNKPKYIPKYPNKYKGVYPIVCRSRWEEYFCRMADLNVNVVEWASEPYRIPYPCPITKKQSIYIPDFIITVKTPRGSLESMLIEIKPKHEAILEATTSQRDRLAHAKNTAKWAAAMWWCERRGIKFKVMTEEDLFGKYEPPKKKRNTVKKAKLAAAKPRTTRTRKK